MVDCGCPDCSYPCGLATDGSEDCVVCDDYDLTITTENAPFFMLEFEDGFGLISGTSNPNISFSGSIDLGINYDACHRDETTVTPYTFMTLRQNAATCFPEPNSCYPFGGFFTFADEDIIEATIMSVPGELEVELTEYEYDDFIGHSYTFPNLTASPILGLYEFGWYGFFTMGPRFTIPDVFTDEETRRRELSLTPADYTLGTCDPPVEDDEEYRYSNLSLQAAAIRIEPPLKFLPYCEDDPEECAVEFKVIIDYPSDKYSINLEIVAEDNGGQAYFQESGTTLLEDVHDGDVYHLITTASSHSDKDIKLVAEINFAPTGKKSEATRKAILFSHDSHTIKVREVGFTNDHVITIWPDGPDIDPDPDEPEPVWKEGDINHPVCYTINTKPRMFAKYFVEPNVSKKQNVMIRARVGDSIIGYVGNCSIIDDHIIKEGENSDYVTDIGYAGLIPGSNNTDKIQFDIIWEYSIDSGSHYFPAGKSGEHTLYTVWDEPLEDKVYDLALDKACSYANGAEDEVTLISQIRSGIFGEIGAKYNPEHSGSIISDHYILELYDENSSDIFMCSNFANLTAFLLRTIGLPATTYQYWYGTEDKYYGWNFVQSNGYCRRTVMLFPKGSDDYWCFSYHAYAKVGNIIVDTALNVDSETPSLHVYKDEGTGFCAEKLGKDIGYWIESGPQLPDNPDYIYNYPCSECNQVGCSNPILPCIDDP